MQRRKLINYSLQVLEIDQAIANLQMKLSTQGIANTEKLFYAQAIRDLTDAKKCQQENLHRYVASGLCSCGLKVETIHNEPVSATRERVFRSRGHIDHLKGKLTTLFVRKWPAISTAGAFLCWWCVECGYLGATGEDMLHECRSEAYRRELLRELRTSYVRIGHAHYNHATRKYANLIEATLDEDSDFIKFQPVEETDENSKWRVFCTVCGEFVGEPCESRTAGWLYEYRERHRDFHLTDRQMGFLLSAESQHDLEN
jgi:hypothetical protein